MTSLSFRKDLVGVQEELLRFAYKLTTDREEASDWYGMAILLMAARENTDNT